MAINYAHKELSFEEVQKIAFGILEYIHSICEPNGIKYSLAYGTLIGAVRHSGFIPWDDDIDIMMPRPDYERLQAFFNSHDTGNYRLMNLSNTQGYPYFNTRICDIRTMIDVKNEEPCGMGVFVDICILDGLGNDRLNALKKLKTSKRLCSLMFLTTRTRFHIGLTKGMKKKILKFPVYLVTHLIGKNFFIKSMNKLLRNCDYKDSSLVGSLVWSTYSPEKELLNKELIENVHKTKFESGEFYIFSSYHEVLTQLYGNYMVLPPVQERIHHHLYTAYLNE